MYHCSNCSGNFARFQVPGQCPLCAVRACVRCQACRHTAEAESFIKNDDLCPACGAVVTYGVSPRVNSGSQEKKAIVGCLGMLLFFALWGVGFVVYNHFGKPAGAPHPRPIPSSMQENSAVANGSQWPQALRDRNNSEQFAARAKERDRDAKFDKAAPTRHSEPERDFRSGQEATSRRLSNQLDQSSNSLKVEASVERQAKERSERKRRDREDRGRVAREKAELQKLAKEQREIEQRQRVEAQRVERERAELARQESAAREMVRLAKRLKLNEKVKLTRTLEDVISRFEHTDAAAEARRMLLEMAENAARSRLILAKSLLKLRKAGAAKEYLEEIIKKYPQTDAAQESQRLLKELR